MAETFGDQIRIIFKDFPLNTHPQAFKAAEGAQCARVQGRFWEYHDTLFANQGALAIADLKRYAGELSLDQAAFDNCLDSGETASLVQQDLAEAERYGISSTPTLFINGRMVAGALPYETFAELISDELARVR
ncbi:MAG TPA: hypothetical protein DCP38_05990 [Acidobacteria bacterium]|nr:hypothetical protein [Acidobacteriota bacterium]MDP6372562.1 thioredoxin domain-containing protein [Vicinamibacterales bacterium]MBU22568.1 hypothetical protein [Acidobacteriota bacterium]MDP7294379.1 thioredoxin domain-containing protein [Vicinamibacterales bacterium]MDP7472963.1 thioredoxin domain-containing protein [Vicinamibacterales bacterium]